MNVAGPYWWRVNIGSGNGLVPSGTTPSPEPMLTQIRDILQWDARAVFVTTVIADGAKSKSEFKYAMQSGRHTMRRGRQCTNIYTWALLWHHTFACKQWNQNLPTHKFVSALLCSYFLLYLRHSLNGNTNFKIYFVLGKCYTRHLAIGATTKLFIISFWNRTNFFVISSFILH